MYGSRPEWVELYESVEATQAVPARWVRGHIILRLVAKHFGHWFPFDFHWHHPPPGQNSGAFLLDAHLLTRLSFATILEPGKTALPLDASAARGPTNSLSVFSLITFLSLILSYTGCGIKRTVYWAPYILANIATSNALSVGLLGVWAYYMLTLSAQKSYVDWLSRVPVLSSMLDLTVSVIW